MATGQPAAPRSRTGRGRRLLIELVETISLTVLIFLGVQAFVAQPFKVDGGSMEITLLPDEHVLVDKLTPRWMPYERGDIVVLNPPLSAGGGGTRSSSGSSGSPAMSSASRTDSCS